MTQRTLETYGLFKMDQHKIIGKGLAGERIVGSYDGLKYSVNGDSYCINDSTLLEALITCCFRHGDVEPKITHTDSALLLDYGPLVVRVKLRNGKIAGNVEIDSGTKVSTLPFEGGYYLVSHFLFNENRHADPKVTRLYYRLGQLIRKFLFK